jgi:hypothetical protein
VVPRLCDGIHQKLWISISAMQEESNPAVTVATYNLLGALRGEAKIADSAWLKGDKELSHSSSKTI